jgi:hypothetical protein
MKHLKLRWFILVLMLLNALFYIWREGLFADWGFAPDSVRETTRIQQQIRPDNVVIERKSS